MTLFLSIQHQMEKLVKNQHTQGIFFTLIHTHITSCHYFVSQSTIAMHSLSPFGPEHVNYWEFCPWLYLFGLALFSLLFLYFSTKVDTFICSYSNTAHFQINLTTNSLKKHQASAIFLANDFPIHTKFRHQSNSEAMNFFSRMLKNVVLNIFKKK